MSEYVKNTNSYKVDKSRVINLEKGKIPPQAIDLEETVLGACLIDKKGVDDLFGVFTDENVFYKDAHKHIFLAFKKLYGNNEPIDLLSVSYKLKELGLLDKIGGDYYLISLTQRVSSSAHQDFHARVILQKYIAREVILISNESIEDAYDEKTDIFDLIDSITSKIDGVSDMINKGYTSLSWMDAVDSVPKRVEFLTNNNGNITGVPTGLRATDKHFSGWQPEDFIVIGADSGMGKTAFVFNNIIAAAKADLPVGMFSMEMSVVQLAVRGVATESEFHLNQLMRNGFEKPEYFDGLMKVTSRVRNYPIYIDDQAALTVIEMKRKARTLVRKYGIKLLVIDFLQMFSGDADIRINVGDAARACKNLAKELKIPIIALSQLSREVRKVKYCIPSKHHLKESSAIEEAADVIGLLYRPSYYGFSPESYPDLYNELGLMKDENACLLVNKNRNGALGNVGLHFVENKTKFINPGDIFNSEDKTVFDG